MSNWYEQLICERPKSFAPGDSAVPHSSDLANIA